MVYVTGDVHGYFGRIVRFAQTRPSPSPDDVLVILGDVGANFWCDENDDRIRDALGNLSLWVLCVHGNHEARPDAGLGYREMEWRGGTVFVDDARPRLLFAKDGSVFDLEGASCLVAGGAYSADKRFRLEDGRRWFSDEQPGPQERAAVEHSCADAGWRVDYVFSHTIPLGERPTEAFMASVNQREVDTSTEEWLESVAGRLSFRRWFSGHFHINKRPAEGRFWVLFKEIVRLADGAVVYDEAADARVLDRFGVSAPHPQLRHHCPADLA